MLLSRKVVLDAPVEVVFDFLADPAKIESWTPEVVSWKLLTDPPLRAGSRVAFERRDANATSKAVSEVLVFERPARFESVTELTDMPSSGKPRQRKMRETWSLRDLGDGLTEVDIMVEIALSGFLRFVDGLFRAGQETAFDSAIERLRAAVAHARD